MRKTVVLLATLATLWVLAIVIYAFIPSVVWVFGGNFTDIAHNPMYGSIMVIILLLLFCVGTEFIWEDWNKRITL
jgi:hypothetical protein